MVKSSKESNSIAVASEAAELVSLVAAEFAGALLVADATAEPAVRAARSVLGAWQTTHSVTTALLRYVQLVQAQVAPAGEAADEADELEAAAEEPGRGFEKGNDSSSASSCASSSAGSEASCSRPEDERLPLLALAEFPLLPMLPLLPLLLLAAGSKPHMTQTAELSEFRKVQREHGQLARAPARGEEAGESEAVERLPSVRLGAALEEEFELLPLLLCFA